MTNKVFQEKDAYKEAGVDIDAGEAVVKNIKDPIKKTHRDGVISDLGGFGALFDIKATGKFKDPLLVSSTDGVGTKLKIAIETGIHDSVGIDLVAMCVNDLIVQGAEPLFFLDYFASGKLDVEVTATVIKGIAEGCVEAGCALIGGETAEMPSMYADKHYDLAGFVVGAVDRDQLVTGDKICEGDVLLALPSSGLHSNGYSLVRKIVEDSGLKYTDAAPYETNKKTLGADLLTPTKIYIRSISEVLKTGHIKGLANITGGGLLENIPRILPEGLGANIDSNNWVMPPVFQWLKQQGNLSDRDMVRSLNCGIGMVVIVAKENIDDVISSFENMDEKAFKIGQVVKDKRGEVSIHGMTIS